jgi:hypothetical protein
MFTYINENFLHAPSTDLSRETVKTLIQIMLAQGQEVFLEKQIADGKKVGLLAKLASQAGYLYAQAVEGTQENVNKAIFEKVWLLVVQVRVSNRSPGPNFYLDPLTFHESWLTITRSNLVTCNHWLSTIKPWQMTMQTPMGLPSRDFRWQKQLQKRPTSYQAGFLEVFRSTQI